MIVAKSTALLQRVGNFNLLVDGSSTSPSPEVRNLGVILDSTLSYQAHIKAVTKSAFFSLKNISRLRPSLSDSAAKTLVNALVTSRLDYCNGLLWNLPDKTLERLQYVQNSAARVITRTKRWQHITPTLKNLHWLPIQSRIKFKLLLLTYKCQQGIAPSYLSDLLQPHIPARNLRSIALEQLAVPHTRLKSVGERAFSFSAPKLWNELPIEMRHAPTLQSFKSALKRHLFTNVYAA